MDVPELPKQLHLAGRQYYEQLRKLGLRPEGLFWTHDVPQEKFVLWLVWSGVDRFGPFALTDLLFQAYRSAALTQEIDPFLVDVRSPSDVWGGQVLEMMRTPKPPHTKQMQYRVARDKEGGEILYQWDSTWVYHLERKRKPTLDVTRDWRRFNENISKLAA